MNDEYVKLVENSNKEYVIWGIKPGEREESLLLAKPNGMTITNMTIAKKFKKWVEDKGATKVRIQEIDLMDNDIGIEKVIK